MYSGVEFYRYISLEVSLKTFFSDMMTKGNLKFKKIGVQVFSIFPRMEIFAFFPVIFEALSNRSQRPVRYCPRKQ